MVRFGLARTALAGPVTRSTTSTPERRDAMHDHEDLVLDPDDDAHQDSGVDDGVGAVYSDADPGR
jgi:hypothetical protein